MKKKFNDMPKDQQRREVAKKIKYYEARLQDWLKVSRKLNTGTWTKADDDLLDTLLEKEHG
jgi:hypothetical protein